MDSEWMYLEVSFHTYMYAYRYLWYPEIWASKTWIRTLPSLWFATSWIPLVIYLRWHLSPFCHFRALSYWSTSTFMIDEFPFLSVPYPQYCSLALWSVSQPRSLDIEAWPYVNLTSDRARWIEKTDKLQFRWYSFCVASTSWQDFLRVCNSVVFFCALY